MLLALAIAPMGLAPAAPQEFRFAPPVRLRAGDSFAGEGRYYPSPVLHDVDGDGLQDLVIGDLGGRITFARRLPGEGARFAAEEPLKGADGEILRFHNW